MEDTLDQGFLLGTIRVYPLDARVTCPNGEHRVSPIALEILTTLAKSGGEPVTAAHLTAQVWGQVRPDEGTLDHYIGELRHLLQACAADTVQILEAGSAGYWLSEKPVPLSEDTSSGGFLSELRRRKVAKTAFLYAVAGWGVIQVTETTLPVLGFTDATLRFIIITVIVGFPVALLFSWFYDIRVVGAQDERVEGTTRARLGYVVVAALMTVTIAFGYEKLTETEEEIPTALHLPPPDAVPEENSIAVLAFVNMSGDDSYDYFGDGLAEEILHTLSLTGKLLVAPRTASFYFKGKDANTEAISNQLRVRNILAGSVRRHENLILVTAELFDAVSGYTTWSRTYERELSDVIGIQREISKQVARSLNIVLSPRDNALLSDAPTQNAHAYDTYLRARERLREPPTAEVLRVATSLFEQAIQLDPNYADAYAGLCATHLAHYSLTKASVWYTRADDACQTAMRFDVVTTDVRIALGKLYRESGQLDAAELELHAALDAAPDNVDAIVALAGVYAADNRPAEAEALYAQAISVQRSWIPYVALANFLFAEGRAGDALPYYQHVLLLTPDNAAAHSNLGAAYLMLADFDAAAAAWQESLRLAPTEIAYSNSGSSLYFSERFDEAAQMYEKATDLAPHNHVLWGNWADAARFGATPNSAPRIYQRAIMLAERQLAINPADAETKAILAHYYANTSEREKAQQLIDVAVAAEPGNLSVWYYAALVWSVLGDIEKATAAADRAQELGYPAALLAADVGLAVMTMPAETSAGESLSSGEKQ